MKLILKILFAIFVVIILFTIIGNIISWSFFNGPNLIIVLVVIVIVIGGLLIGDDMFFF